MDIALIQNRLTGEIDIDFLNDEFLRDEGMESSVLISLFSDSRDEENEGDKRGWWGASVLTEDRQGAQFGSQLWRILREKQTDETLIKVNEWCSAALEWMVEQEIATRIFVESQYLRMGVALITVNIERGERDPLEFKFQYLWDGQYAI